jgi:hypothetical protein
MAKIHARGATEVARIITRSHEAGVRFIWLLRSDRKVLRRIADGNLKTGYKVLGTLKPGMEASVDTLRSIAVKRGHIVESK